MSIVQNEDIGRNRSIVAPKLAWDEAVKLLLEKAVPLGTQEVYLGNAYGRVLAADVTALQNVPSFDRSPYDGYAFRASDTENASKENPVTLKVVEDLRAGQRPGLSVSEGTAVRLMTGAPLPEGADAICKYEDTVFTEETVTLMNSYKPLENVVMAGEDIKKGTLIGGRGDIIDAGFSGVLASLGMITVTVYKRPIAGIITTGDEIMPEGAYVDNACMIRDSNRHIMGAALRSIGFETVYLGHAKDSLEDIEGLIRNGAFCDVIISTGGVSVGDYDLVPDAMQKAGYELFAGGVLMKPGMACAYGMREGKLMLALSGNPASSLTNLQCVCYPALKKLSGAKEYSHKLIKMKLGEDMKKGGGMVRFIRGRLEIEEGEAYLSAPKRQGNIVISSAAGCNAYGMIPVTGEPVNKGTLIDGFTIADIM